jgi:hypothetical protein
MEISTYALFSSLLKDVGTDSGPPHLAANHVQAAKRSLLSSLLKKFNTGSTEQADSAALLKFLQSNHRCKGWSLQLNTSSDEELWGEFKNSIYRFWHREGYPLCCAETDLLPLSRGRVGPGAAVGAIGESFYAKAFNSPLSCTRSDLYFSYKSYIARFPVWREADDLRTLAYADPDIVEGSRLSFVPKTAKISRCICVEPNLNMYYQLGFGDVLTSRLNEYYGISLADQPFRNRDLARIGSIFDSNVTIDLESASDSIAVNFCKEVLPKSLWDLLSRYRCSSTNVPGLGMFELDMVSSMGNGFTFPLQTMLFCAMVEASFRYANKRFPTDFSQKQWGVFGDDIIVPQGMVMRFLLRLLKLSGFVVNDDKSFLEGPFRESCGADYYNGRDVRGVYLKSLKTPQDICVAINRLNHFTMQTGVKLPNTVQYLLRFVPRLFVPLHEADDAGIKVPSSLLMLGKKGVSINENGSWAYKAYKPRSKRIRFAEDGISVPRFLRKRGYFFNGPGAWMAFLQRSLDGAGFTLRLKSTPYALVKCITPNWDMHSATHPLAGWLPWQRLEDAVYLNICL